MTLLFSCLDLWKELSRYEIIKVSLQRTYPAGEPPAAAHCSKKASASLTRTILI